MSDPRTPAQSAPEAERPTGPCPHIVSSDEGTGYCRLAEDSVRAAESRARAAEEELERVRGRLWYCASCRDWKPTILQAGDMVCACGYIVASYHDRAGSQGEERG